MQWIIMGKCRHFYPVYLRASGRSVKQWVLLLLSQTQPEKRAMYISLNSEARCLLTFHTAHVSISRNSMVTLCEYKGTLISNRRDYQGIYSNDICHIQSLQWFIQHQQIVKSPRVPFAKGVLPISSAATGTAGFEENTATFSSQVVGFYDDDEWGKEVQMHWKATTMLTWQERTITTVSLFRVISSFKQCFRILKV